MEIGKVLVLIDDIALIDVEEHRVAQDGEDEEDEHEENENVQERVDRHHDCLHERLETLVCLREAEHTTHTQYTKHSSELRANRQDLTSRFVFLAALGDR